MWRWWNRSYFAIGDWDGCWVTHTNCCFSAMSLPPALLKVHIGFPWQLRWKYFTLARKIKVRVLKVILNYLSVCFLVSYPARRHSCGPGYSLGRLPPPFGALWSWATCLSLLCCCSLTYKAGVMRKRMHLSLHLQWHLNETIFIRTLLCVRHIVVS